MTRYTARSFAYAGTSTTPANNSASPTIGGEVVWVPLMHFGLDFAGEYASWLKILDKYPSVILDLRASAVVRFPVSFGYGYAHAGVFRHSFTVADDGGGRRQELGLPDVVYVGARAGGGLHANLSPQLSANVEGSYRYVAKMVGGRYPVTSDGFFPRATSGPAVDAAIFVTFRLTPLFNLTAGVDFRGYKITTGATSQDRIDAASATDLYVGGWLGVAGVFGGRSAAGQGR